MKKLVLTMAFIALAGMVSAQKIGINFSGFQTVGEFNQNIDKNPVGIGIIYTQGIGPTKRLNFGISASVAMYSYEEFTVQNNRGEEVKMYEEDCFWTAHALAQYNIYTTVMMNLYGEFRMGFTTFFSEKVPLSDGSGIKEEVITHGTAFNTGMGGGLEINISGFLRGNAYAHNRLWLDIGVSANSGTSSKYRNSGEEGQVTIDDANYKTLTNYVHYRAGLSFRLGKK